MESNTSRNLPIRKKRPFLFQLIYYPVFVIIVGLLLDLLFYHQITNIKKTILHDALLGISVAVIMRNYTFGKTEWNAKNISLTLFYIILTALIMVIIEKILL
jgi:hypothetical protein